MCGLIRLRILVFVKQNISLSDKRLFKGVNKNKINYLVEIFFKNGYLDQWVVGGELFGKRLIFLVYKILRGN